MKPLFALIASLLLLGMVAVVSGQAGGPGKPSEVNAAEQTFTEAQMMEMYGWFLARQTGVAELQLTAEEIAALLKGVNAAAEGKLAPHDPEKIGGPLDELMKRKQAAYQQREKEKAVASSDAFSAKSKENKNVVTLPSGLQYEILAPGEGPAPQPEDTVLVRYTGSLPNGRVFYRPLKGGAPDRLALKEMIPGLAEGIQKIARGGRVKLYIPPALSKSPRGEEVFPSSSTLVFEIELVEIVKPGPGAGRE